MRGTMSPRSSLVAVLLGVSLGCGSNVVPADDGGGGGAGGSTPSNGGAPTNGGAPSTGGQSNQGGAPDTTTVASGGSSGNACEEVCGRVEECFGITCEQFNIDCDSPEAQCPAECAIDASCDELAAIAQGDPPPEVAECLEVQCGIGGDGGGGTGGDGAGGAPPQDCNPCLFQNDCLDPCMGQQACQGWGQCAFNCQSPDCYANCNAMFPQAEPFYSQIYPCICDNCPGCEERIDACSFVNEGGGGANGG
jgi:hypothetical protein